MKNRIDRFRLISVQFILQIAKRPSLGRSQFAPTDAIFIPILTVYHHHGRAAWFFSKVRPWPANVCLPQGPVLLRASAYAFTKMAAQEILREADFRNSAKSASSNDFSTG